MRQVRPRLTVEEVRYLLYLVELQRETLQNYPENFPNRSESWNKLQKDVLFKHKLVCKWLQHKFTKLLQDGRFAVPGILGFVGRAYIPNVLNGMASLRELARTEDLEAEQKQPEKAGEIDWLAWLKKPEGSDVEV